MNLRDTIEGEIRTIGWTMGLVIIVGVLGFQLLLGSLAIFNSGGNLVVALTGIYVASMILLGYLYDYFRSNAFLACLFAGWSILLGISSIVSPSTSSMLVAGLTAVCSVYYSFSYLY